MANMMDSQLWLEYFAGTKIADEYSYIMEDSAKLIVPTISIAEVFRTLIQQVQNDLALKAIAHMQLGKVIDLDVELCLFGAKLAHEHKISLTSGQFYASALKHNATFWTFDANLEKKPNVEYRKPKETLSSFRLYRG